MSASARPASAMAPLMASSCSDMLDRSITRAWAVVYTPTMAACLPGNPTGAVYGDVVLGHCPLGEPTSRSVCTFLPISSSDRHAWPKRERLVAVTGPGRWRSDNGYRG